MLTSRSLRIHLVRGETGQTSETKIGKARNRGAHQVDAGRVSRPGVGCETSWSARFVLRKKTPLRKEDTNTMKQQSGHIFFKKKKPGNGKKRGVWCLRYYDSRLIAGKIKRVQLCKQLAEYSDQYRCKDEVKGLAFDILGPINSGKQAVESTTRIADFIANVYLPDVEKEARASTVKNCRDIFRLHIKPRLGAITLRDFRTADGQRLIEDIARLAKTKKDEPLRHASLARIKSFMSAVFASAKRLGYLDAINPIVGIKVPKGSPAGTTYAHSLAEIKSILSVLPEPARTVVLTAAFTGLRQGELCGLRWSDYDGKTLTISRSVWKKNVINPPKTNSSAAPIPVVPQLREALEAHRQRLGILANRDLPIFQSGIGTPLNLANLAKRVIIPAIEKCKVCRKSKNEHRPEAHLFQLDKTLCWHGWHAFRRGLATNLHDVGVPDKEIQAILRHSNIAVTQQIYIKSISENQTNALNLLAEEMGKNPECTENAPNGKESIN
jgi:integrase